MTGKWSGKGFQWNNLIRIHFLDTLAKQGLPCFEQFNIDLNCNMICTQIPK